MHTEKITLPNNELIELYFQEQHPPLGFDAPGVLAVLQYRKDGKSQPLMEQTFEKMYPQIAKDFAKSLLNSEPSIVAIITPPSSTWQFRPFIEACKALQPRIAAIEDAFQKPDGFKSGNPGTLIDHVRQAFALDRTKVTVFVPQT